MNKDRELKRIRTKLTKENITGDDSVLLTGLVDNWTSKINAGFIAAKRGFRWTIGHLRSTQDL